VSNLVEDNKFLGLIVHLTDLPLDVKIKILEYWVTQLEVPTEDMKADNLRLLEYKQTVKELKDELAKTGK